MFEIIFKIHGNPDRNEGDWEETHTRSAQTIKELRASVLKFQGDNDIGGGNWGEACLYQNGTLVGHVSYNLRVWEKPYWEAGSVEVVV